MHAVNENNEIAQLQLLGGALVVTTIAEAAGTLYTDETNTQGASRTRKDIPLGARVVVVDTNAIAGATARYLWLTFNAANDAAAATALASPTSRIRIPIGRAIELSFSDAAKCSRIDYATDGNGATPTCDVSLRMVV